jgi:helix-turn-helix protein
MSERQTFGPRLRSERERRGIALETIVTVTKVAADLWEGLEKNDFSRWPTGLSARAFVRDYATAVGLDADEVVDEFCRLFPVGDRRTARIIKAQAELIGHDPAVVVEDTALMPASGDRRAVAREKKAEARARRIRFAPRTVAALIDIACTVSIAALGPVVLGASFWTTLGATTLVYFTVATVFSGSSPGTRAVDLLRHRVPALFAVHDSRAHA